MSQVVTITRQGQLTIPRGIRKVFQMVGSTKAVLSFENGKIIVEPKADFWSVSGSLGSKVRLSDAKLADARATFQKNWSRRP